jgi:hypothetical protein
MKFKTFLINLLLFFVAGFLVILFSGIGLFSALVSITFNGVSTRYFRDCAIELDIFGNILCQVLFNLLLIKKESIYLFGIPGMTISENLGLNQEKKTLTVLGNIVANILDSIEKDHCKNSIR